LDGRVDYLLFKNHLEHELRQLAIQARQFSEIEAAVPFAKGIIALDDARRRMDPINPAQSAALLADIKKQIDARIKALEASLKGASRAGSANYENGGSKPIEPRTGAQVEPRTGTQVEPRTGAPESVDLNKTDVNRAVTAVINVRLILRN